MSILLDKIKIVLKKINDYEILKGHKKYLLNQLKETDNEIEKIIKEIEEYKK